MSITFIEKREVEQIYRYHQFRRTDNVGWLGTTETLTTQDVTILDSANADLTSTMIDNTAIYSDTQVRYRVKGGQAGKNYTILITVDTSAGNKFEDVITLKVK